MAQALPDDSVVAPIRGGVQAPLMVAAAAQRRRLADDTAAWFARNEVHFGVSIAGEVVQRPIPYDPLPRIVDSVEWAWLERALAQRVRALDEFVRDAYGEARI
ncbi:MAG TPA: circularly permuted type 2 ATP-grasp protein, partial [Candidatus Dormibacteraeota bacterium]|nr:circularly permuted type 2 ATP-grasp protein [Candidatus Dormibacteraeota bacterium]